VARVRSFVMGARGLDMTRDRAQQAARPHARDPTAMRGIEYRAERTERVVTSAEDQAEVTVACSLFDGERTGEFRGRTAPFGNQVTE
jgi:hypothetical protein